MKPIAKRFTRDNPCTKLELWQCFRSATGFRRVPVVEAHAIIGVNVPRIMEREGRMVRVEKQGIEYYELTTDGGEWLLQGFNRYLKNHPSHVARASHIPTSWGYSQSSARLRRTR